MKVHLVKSEIWQSETEGKLLADLCIPLLRKAERYASGRFRAEDLIIDCVRGKSDCWIGVDGDNLRMCGITNIVHYPRQSCLSIQTVGAEVGYLRDWVPPAVEALKIFASLYDLDKIEILAGRHGWVRVLENYGFISKLSVFEVDLCPSVADPRDQVTRT